jgi:DnaJ-class molecular chaperone
LFASSSPFLNDFKTSKGEVVDPYRVLKIPRDASTPMIKKAYRELSRRYHPDGNRHRTILPGSCNSWEEVRDHWERIRISYEILKSPILRKRYDRHEVMSDPKAAIQRAAVGAAVRGVKSVGRGLFQGLFSAGSFAYEKFTKEMQQPPPAKRSPDDSSSEAVESKSDGTTRVAVEETTVMMAATSDGSSSPIPGLAP